MARCSLVSAPELLKGQGLTLGDFLKQRGWILTCETEYVTNGNGKRIPLKRWSATKHQRTTSLWEAQKRELGIDGADALPWEQWGWDIRDEEEQREFAWE